MSHPTLTRLSALAIFVPALLNILFSVTLPIGLVPAGLEYPAYLVLYGLFVFTLVAFYARVSRRAGLVGLTGFIFSAIAIFLAIGFNYYAALVFPILRDQFPGAIQPILSGPVNGMVMAGFVLTVLGNLLLFASALRVRDLPRWAIWMAIVGSLVTAGMLPYNVSGVIISIGLIGVAQRLWSEAHRPAPALQPQPV
jgi:hypothetical protein